MGRPRIHAGGAAAGAARGAVPRWVAVVVVLSDGCHTFDDCGVSRLAAAGTLDGSLERHRDGRSLELSWVDPAFEAETPQSSLSDAVPR